MRLSEALLRELNQFVEHIGTSKTDVTVSVIGRSLALRDRARFALCGGSSFESASGGAEDEVGKV